MNLHLLQKRVIAQPDKFFAEKYAHNMSFCFSTYQLSNSSTRTVRGRNTVNLNESDIGFDSGVMSASQISALGGGNEVVSPIFYNQKGSYTGNLNAATSITTRPAIVDNLNNPVDYIRSRVQGEGYWTPFTIASPPDMTADYIVSFITRKELNINTQRPHIYLKTDSTNVFSAIWLKADGFLRVGILIDVESGFLFDFYHDLPIDSIDVNYGLFTFSRIGGTVKFYFNGVEKNLLPPPIVGVLPYPDSRGLAGVGLNARPISLPLGKINEFQSYILHTGANLSLFPIQEYMNDLKEIHGII